MRLKDFHRDGLALAAHAVGRGRPVLVQHGLCGDAAQTAEVIPTDAGWMGVTLECRGHGASGAGPEAALSLATFVDDLAVFIEERLGGPVVVGGISMGAALALRLAVTRPDLVSGLCLLRPAWVCEPAPANMAPYAVAGALLGQHGPEEARARFERLPLARRLAAEAPDNLETLRRLLSREPLARTAALLSRVSADGPGVSPAEVAALRVPTLVIGHGQDLAHPWAHAEALAGLILGARLVRVAPKAESRHRHRDGVCDALAHFLQELPP
jgi:pimeloyl-ACP methyl ester carboxylesterase